MKCEEGEIGVYEVNGMQGGVKKSGNDNRILGNIKEETLYSSEMPISYLWCIIP